MIVAVDGLGRVRCFRDQHLHQKTRAGSMLSCIDRTNRTCRSLERNRCDQNVLCHRCVCQNSALIEACSSGYLTNLFVPKLRFSTDLPALGAGDARGMEPTLFWEGELDGRSSTRKDDDVEVVFNSSACTSSMFPDDFRRKVLRGLRGIQPVLASDYGIRGVVGDRGRKVVSASSRSVLGNERR